LFIFIIKWKKTYINIFSTELMPNTQIKSSQIWLL
jgi:hypothetical protein